MATIIISKKCRAALHALLNDGGQECEAVFCMKRGAQEFSTANHRFIHLSALDSIMETEISNDAYTLGCFTASFIAEVTGWPAFLIEAAQKGEQFEAIGEALISGGFTAKLVRAYAGADGYGHHFAHYDGHEYKIGKYLAFRVG